MFLTLIAAVPLLIWTYLLFARGWFWRVSKHFAPPQSAATPTARVAVIIPARNEAPVIGEAITSLLEQDFPVPVHVVVVDDASSDGTADVARCAAENIGKAALLTIVHGQALAPGWTGKLWAVSQGLTLAQPLAPDFFLLTDADIRHGRSEVAELIGIAETGPYDLVSYMAKLASSSAAEKALIPAFVFFFLKLYPPAWIRSNRFGTAGAAGGCILVRPTALEKAGGIGAIRSEVIDDCALARAVKRSGGRVWLSLTEATQSTRSYGSFAEIGLMISRTAFNQLHHSGLLLAGTTAGLFFTYLLPPLLLLTGRTVPVLLGLSAWLLMSFAYWPMVRFYRRAFLWSFMLPLIAAFYMGATIHSAVQYWRGRGGVWKGRVQDVRVR